MVSEDSARSLDSEGKSEMEVIEQPKLKKAQQKTHPKRRLKEHDLEVQVSMAGMSFYDNAITETHETVVEHILFIPRVSSPPIALSQPSPSVDQRPGDVASILGRADFWS